jgi:hypothetical protein
VSNDRSTVAVAVVKAGLSAIPVLGGPLASLVGDYIAASTQRRIEAALEELRQRVDTLGARVDVESVDKEDFAELFKASYSQLVRSHTRSKTSASLGVLLNLLLAPGDAQKLSYDELDHFSRCIDMLSRGALQILPFIEPSRQKPMKMGDLMARYPETDEALLYGLVQELTAVNLVEQPPMRVGSSSVKDQFVIITALGQRFLSHVLALGQKNDAA